MSIPIFTVGHSNRTIEQFVTLLRAGEVDTLVDVRSVGKSKHNPQFNAEVLPQALKQYNIDHEMMIDLGGRRTRVETADPCTNDFWNNQRFHNYADYTHTDNFLSALARLEQLATNHRVAIMCAEAVWWRCHRRFITDYLIDRGHDVFHLMGTHYVYQAEINPAAQRTGNILSYPSQPEQLCSCQKEDINES